MRKGRERGGTRFKRKDRMGFFNSGTTLLLKEGKGIIRLKWDKKRKALLFLSGLHDIGEEKERSQRIS